jgi:shikimate dehydrogenase
MNLRGSTMVFGILGDPVAHSLSPLMQNAAFAEAGIDGVYVPFHVKPDDLKGAVEALRALRIRGVNVTVPHKEAICPFLDRLDPLAKLIGAVNTVRNDEGILTGFNTDATGFLRSLEEDLHWHPEGRRVLLLGAGGACRAAVAALAGAGVSRISIANRTEERGERLAQGFRGLFPGTTFANLPLDFDRLAAVLPEVDLVVNTSAVGLQEGTSVDLPWGLLPRQALFYDMVYRRGGTDLLIAAARHGIEGACGLGMLACQGEDAFLIWTGRRPAPGVMRGALEREMY